MEYIFEVYPNENEHSTHIIGNFIHDDLVIGYAKHTLFQDGKAYDTPFENVPKIGFLVTLDVSKISKEDIFISKDGKKNTFHSI